MSATQRNALPLFDDDFAAWWAIYPLKVGKLQAQRAYDKLRRAGITQDELLDGVEEYVKHKPDWQHYCYPATWLNNRRWMDEAPPPSAEERKLAAEYRTKVWGGCPHSPRCAVYAACLDAVVAYLRSKRR